jgi:YHS domain-containing protein
VLSLARLYKGFIGKGILKMRILLATTLSALAIGLTGVASAQTTAEPVPSVEATEQAEAKRQSSWYGEPLAVSGQDVVSFLAEGGPVQGSDAFVAEYDNTQWRFASAENRDEFLSDPDRYVPAFGGYCPVALAAGEVKIGSAEHFKIVGEELYLNYDGRSSNLFENDPDGYIVAAKLNF